jgi:rubrerythrin
MGKFRESRTAQNLLCSFAGESQARNRYTYFETVTLGSDQNNHLKINNISFKNSLISVQ